MLNEYEIKTALYKIIKASELPDMVGGEVRKEARPATSTAEDICITVYENAYKEVQMAIVYINIYVADKKKRNGEYTEDGERIDKLMKAAYDALTVKRGYPFKLKVETQRAVKVEGTTNERVIINQLYLKAINE